MLLSLILLIPIIFTALFCVGLVGFSVNVKTIVRVYFSLAILFLTGWMICLYFSNVQSTWALFFNRAVYVSPILGLFFLGQFTDAYYKKVPAGRFTKLGLAQLVITANGVVVAISHANVEGIRARLFEGQFSGYDIVPGKLSILVAIVFILLSLSIIYQLLHAYKKADRQTKRPLRIILISFAITVLVAVGANVLAPLLIGGSNSANTMSSIVSIIFIVSIAYSVLRYSFLDVRLLVMRSLGYVVGLAAIIILGALMQTAIFNVLGVGHQKMPLEQQAVLALLFALSALGFAPARTLFAKLTTRFFFKGGYDSAKFIAAFNANLVRHLDIKDLLTESGKEIENTLSPIYCIIGVGETKRTPLFLVGSQHVDLSLGRDLMEAASLSSQQVIVREYSNQKELSPQTFFKQHYSHNIEVLVKLIESVNGKEVTLGFIALGPKRNGDVYNKTDLSVLRIVANELELAIQNALRFEEIQRFNITLQEHIDEATRKLKRSNQKLKELDETKDDFISMASHQLRTPLTSVKGYLSMVIEGDAGKLNPTQAEMLGQAFSSSQRMVSLITDLLNISRLKTGKFVIEPTAINLADIIKGEVAQLTETAKAKNISLDYKVPDKFPALMLDEVKTRQVIMNFIDNAIYYTPQGGHINVELIDKPTTIELRVIDDGIGVPKSEQHHLFSKFYRATNARKARPDGTGLGLFMAKKVIVAQGGSLIFTSQEGHGSTFGFSFIKDRIKVKNTVAASPESRPKQSSLAKKEITSTPVSTVNRESR